MSQSNKMSKSKSARRAFLYHARKLFSESVNKTPSPSINVVRHHESSTISQQLSIDQNHEEIHALSITSTDPDDDKPIDKLPRQVSR